MLWIFSALAATPVYALGFLAFSYWASLDPSLLAWALRAAGFLGLAANPRLAVVAASVVIFLPQDLLMDHPLALLIAHRVARALPSIYDTLAGSGPRDCSCKGQQREQGASQRSGKRPSQCACPR